MSISTGVGVMTTTDKRDAAVAELLRTEAAYVSDMKLLVDVFILPLEKWAADLKSERERDCDWNEADPAVPDLTQEDCAKIFANAKQLANFNRQFLLDLRRAYGGPGQWELVSPVFRDSGNWRRINPLRNGHDDSPNGTSALSTYTATMDNNASKLEGDPFRPSTALEDVDKGPRQMLEVFLKSAPFLKMYSLYVNNFDSATERLTTLERDNPSFVAFLTACEKQKPCRGLHLRDFLILPVQRIPRYRLLLETILQHTAIESSMHSKVEESLTTMGGIASQIDADLSLQEKKDKVYELQQQFGGAEFVTASRLFVKEGELSKVARNGVERLHFVLFNDLLVYGQAKRRRVLGGGYRTKQLYHHRREINLGKCFVVDAPSYGSCSLSVLGETGMLVVSEKKSFMVMASTAVEKDSWLQAIRRCMRDLSSKVGARESLCRIQEQDLDTPRSPISSLGRSSRWSAGSTHSPLLPSAPRSVWVPGKEGHKSVRLVDFSLPASAGMRSYGCLSHTELTWGKEGSVTAGGMVKTASGSLMNPLCGSISRQGSESSDRKRHSRGEKEFPAKTSCEVSMKPPGKLGLRLRDVHPGCGGGVVVLGFESKSAGKRAGMKQGDRITDVDGMSISTIADIVRALSRAWGQLSDVPERPVHLGLLRGFPKSDRPWLPPLEPSPIRTIPSPPSSAVESPSLENSAMSPSEEPLALPSGLATPSPGTKSIEGVAGDSNGDEGYGCVAEHGVPGFPCLDIREAESSSRDFMAVAAAAAAAGTAAARAAVAAAGAATATVFAGGGLLMPPSPEMKVEDIGDSSGDFSGSGDGTGDSGASSLTRAKGPAPPQANANAGGDPAKPFAVHNRKFSRQNSSFSQAATSLTACLSCQTDGALRVWDDENSRPTEFRLVGEIPRKYSIDRLRGTMVGACVSEVPEDDVKDNETFEDLDDERSSASSSSGDSSAFLTAVSPRRIPPPLVAIPSIYPPPLPPISMTSSMVSGSFSPGSTAADTGTPDTSLSTMSWLKPLPPPPPRKEIASLSQHSAWESNTVNTTPPTSTRGGLSTAYPPGRFVQTPPMGTPASAESETDADGDTANVDESNEG